MMPAKNLAHGIGLNELLEGVPHTALKNNPLVTGLCMDSRHAKAGDLFIALQGESTHGFRYISEVIKLGVSAVLIEPSKGINPDSISSHIPLLVIQDLPAYVGQIAKRFYADPSASMDVIAITGTNGKTSCAHYLAQILSLKSPCGVIGTVGNGIYPSLQQATHTTPDVISLNEQLAEFLNQNAASTVMEVSSHGLLQHRIDGVEVGVGVFTNISRDHIDYHGNMNNYFAAKQRLFTVYQPENSVINTDCRYGRMLADSLREKGVLNLYTFGKTEYDSSLHLLVSDVSALASGIEYNINYKGLVHQVQTSLLGRFNVENVTAVIGVLLALKWDMQEILSAVSTLQPAPGRMQMFNATSGARIVVDYAHTPDALEKTLKSLRELTDNKLVCVFGCGGNRDIGKRPQMGVIAETIADEIILTNDNPRKEQPLKIIGDILMGIVEKRKVSVIPDRYAAIHHAISKATNNDIVLVAGKGHETSQIDGNVTKEFSDINVVRTLIRES